MAEHEPKVRILLKKHAQYFERGLPYLDQVEIRMISNESARVNALRSRAVDMIDFVPWKDIDVLRKERGLEVQSEGGAFMNLWFNTSKKPFDDARVRRAIALAIDREAIVRTLWRGHADLADSILAPVFWAHAAGIPPVRHDPAEARRLLELAGYPDPDGGGPQTRFTLTYKTSQNELRRRIAAVIQEQLRQVGIGIAVQSYEWGTFFSDIKKGNFQLYSLTWVGIADPDVCHYAFHSSQVPPDGANRGRYSNAGLDRLLEAGRRELSRPRRKEIYRRVQLLLSRDLPVFPLWVNRNILLRDRRLVGFAVTPDEDYTSVKEMRIEP